MSSTVTVRYRSGGQSLAQTGSAPSRRIDGRVCPPSDPREAAKAERHATPSEAFRPLDPMPNYRSNTDGE